MWLWNSFFTYDINIIIILWFMVMEYYIEQPRDDTGVKKLFYFSKKTYTVLFWSKDTLFKNTEK